MKDCWIVKNTAVAQEIIHKFRKHKGRDGLMVMKIDIKEGYDLMEWSFLIRALELWGFDGKF